MIFFYLTQFYVKLREKFYDLEQENKSNIDLYKRFERENQDLLSSSKSVNLLEGFVLIM